MLMMQRGPDEQTKHKMHLAKALCNEVRGGKRQRRLHSELQAVDSSYSTLWIDAWLRKAPQRSIVMNILNGGKELNALLSSHYLSNGKPWELNHSLQ